MDGADEGQNARNVVGEGGVLASLKEGSLEFLRLLLRL